MYVYTTLYNCCYTLKTPNKQAAQCLTFRIKTYKKLDRWIILLETENYGIWTEMIVHLFVSSNQTCCDNQLQFVFSAASDWLARCHMGRDAFEVQEKPIKENTAKLINLQSAENIVHSTLLILDVWQSLCTWQHRLNV